MLRGPQQVVGEVKELQSGQREETSWHLRDLVGVEVEVCQCLMAT